MERTKVRFVKFVCKYLQSSVEVDLTTRHVGNAVLSAPPERSAAFAERRGRRSLHDLFSKKAVGYGIEPAPNGANNCELCIVNCEFENGIGNTVGTTNVVWYHSEREARGNPLLRRACTRGTRIEKGERQVRRMVFL